MGRRCPFLSLFRFSLPRHNAIRHDIDTMGCYIFAGNTWLLYKEEMFDMANLLSASCVRLLNKYIVVVVLLIALSACTSGSLAQSSGNFSATRPARAMLVAQATLPGQQLWKEGASSFLFGTNDTEEWTPRNIETDPAIQHALHQAGFTLIRSFFLDNASDAAVEQRVQTILNSGAHCLGVITNIFHVTYDEHLVRYLGNRCLLYEFGNEPDYNGISVSTYLQQWNSLVPVLRKLNPNARFIGPVVGPDTYQYLSGFLNGVKLSGILPDAISFHWYPCWEISENDCMAKATTFGDAATRVRQMVQDILGINLPVGISEWNFDPGNPPAAYGDDPAFITQFTIKALQSMIKAGVAFACQFDAASYDGYGHLDMFNINTDQPKPQFYAIRSMIEQYRLPASR
jgi:hypothetical protein